MNLVISEDALEYCDPKSEIKVRRFQHATKPWDYVYCVDFENRKCWIERNGEKGEVRSTDSEILGDMRLRFENYLKRGEWIELGELDPKQEIDERHLCFEDRLALDHIPEE